MPLPSNFSAPFVVNPGLTAIAIAYKNATLIADDVLPRVPVDTPSFNYSLFNKMDSFTVPDTKVGRTSDVNQVDYSATQATASVEDQALDEVVPNRDKAIAQAYGNFIDPQAIATEQIADLLALGREVRASTSSSMQPAMRLRIRPHCPVPASGPTIQTRIRQRRYLLLWMG